jgi:gliding motility-associated-like protein
MIRIFLTLLVLGLFLIGNAQNAGNVWHFGNGCVLDFNSNPPSVSGGITATQIYTNEGSAVQCDASGQLLFYTDGSYIWDRNNNLMPRNLLIPGGVGNLGGNSTSTSSALIVPNPGNANQYYVFAIAPEAGSIPALIPFSGLSYVVVDMTLNGGFGDFLQDPIVLIEPTTEKVTATPHCNGTDYWILTHEWDSNRFFAFQVTASGISPPVISSSGIAHVDADNNGNFAEAIGYMKCSPDGSKVALAIQTPQNVIEVFDFDNATGQVSNPTMTDLNFSPFDPNTGGPYGISFSTNSQLLYSTFISLDTCKVFQYDLTQSNPVNSRVTLYELPVDLNVSSALIGALQLAPDGKIYVTIANDIYLSTIENPNIPGTGCSYTNFSVTFTPENYPAYGLPTFNDYLFKTVPDSIIIRDSCAGFATQLSLNDTAGIINVFWDFGDPTSGPANQSNALSPNHTFLVPGSYTVTAILQEKCRIDTIIQDIEIVTCYIPCEAFLTAEGFCSGLLTEFTLSGDGDIQNVIWTPDTTQTFNEQLIGSAYSFVYALPDTYTLQAIVDLSCGVDAVYQTFTVSACIDSSLFCEVYIPNTYTPQDDGVNELFGAVSECDFDFYEWRVYNRWGEVVFSSNDADASWDGNYNGLPCQDGIYQYVVRYALESDQIPQIILGHINLLR